MGILLALIAGMFVPLTNLCVRKSVDVGGSTKAFFVIELASSFLFAFLLGPVRHGDFSIPLSVAILGTLAGIVLSIMLYALGRAVEKGPPGLTFAILFSATVMPGLLMALLFGAEKGFEYNAWHGLGSLLVLGGLFWAAKGLQGMKDIKSWLLFATLMFFLHVLLLGIYQWRAMLVNANMAGMKSEWFTPFMFFAAGVIQFFIFLRAEPRMPKRGEVAYGFLGGVFNLLCTFFIIWATERASPLENAVIFPIYSVVGIILTNLWGQKLYQEQVNWRACQLCLFGLIVGTVDWKAVSAAIGF